MNAKKCLLGVAIRTSLATSWEWSEGEENGRDRCGPLVQRALLWREGERWDNCLGVVDILTW